VQEHALDRDLVGLELTHQAPEREENLAQPRRVVAFGADAAPLDRGGAMTVDLDDSEPGDLRSRIDAEDA